MRRFAVRQVLRGLVFSLVLILGIVQLPSLIGRQCLLLALLICPFRPVNDFVDYMICLCAARWFYCLLILYFVAILPEEAYCEAGSCIGRFLYAVYNWIIK